MSTQATLVHHLQALAEGVDSILSDYTERSVLFTPDGPLRGLDEIRAFFTGFLASSPPGLIQAMALLREDIDGEVAYVLWHAEPFVPLATETFVVRGGKIVAQTLALLMRAPHDA